MSAPRTATAAAHPNIALAKYWGKRPYGHNLPAVPSLSATLEGMRTLTRVRFDTSLEADQLELGGKLGSGAELERVSSLLDRVRALLERLGDHCGEARLRGLLQQFDMIDAAQRDRRSTVHMRIDRAFQQGVDALFDLGVCWSCHFLTELCRPPTRQRPALFARAEHCFKLT